MNQVNAGAVEDDALAGCGVHRDHDRAHLRFRERTSGAVRLLSISGPTTELTIDTTRPHPDHCIIGFLDADTTWSRVDGESWAPTPGGLVLAPNGIRRRLRWTGPWRITAALVPRVAISSFVSVLPDAATVSTDRRLLDTSMQQFISHVLETDTGASSVEQYAIEQLVMEMSGAMLLDRIGAVSGRGTPHEVLRTRALAVIAQQCSDGSLTPSRVAHEVQSSLRQLQVVFAQADITVAGQIRHQRARLARSLLLNSRYDRLSIEQISQRAGFQSPMSLRRALDEAYRSTPRALRAARRA